MSSPRPGFRARVQRRVRGLVVLAASAGMLALSGVAPAAASTPTPAPQDEGRVELHVAVGSHGVVSAGAAVSATITVVNDTDDELTAGRLTLELDRTPLADSAAVEAWLSDETAAGSFEGIATEASTPVEADGSSAAALTVPAERIGALAPGVYPIRATLSGATTGDVQDDTLTSRDTAAASVLIVDDGRRPQVTTIVPITATPAAGDLLTAEELGELTATDGALTEQLDAVTGTAAVLAIDPAIPAAIRVLGQSAPASATAWLARLETLSNERFLLQFGDADATVQARAGLAGLLAPQSLSSYLDPADFTPEDATPTPAATDGPTPAPTDTPAPTGSPAPVQPELPDDAELTAVRGALDGILWPLGDVTTADLATFAGYLGGEATTVLPSSAAAAASSPLGVVDGHRVLLTAAPASDAFSRAASTGDDLARQNAIAEGLAHLAVAPDADRVLIGLDRDETRDADALQDTVTALATTGVPATLASLLSTPPASITLNARPDDTRATALQTMLADEGRLQAFSSILDDPLVLLVPERIRLLRVIAVGAADRFDDAVATHRVRTETTLDAVGIQPPSAVQLFTAAAPLPVWVRNDLPWPVNVRLSAEPSDARLTVEPVIDLVAQPSSNTRVKVPVEARVGSGALQVRFTLASPTGVPLGDQQVADVTVRAEWEGIGLGVLGGVIALLLVVGLVRTIRRRRTSGERGDPGTAAPSAGGAS